MTAFDGLEFRVITSRRMSAAHLPAVVLVHGIGVSHRYLSRLHSALSLHRDVFSIDLPGFGGLPKPDTDIDVPAMAAGLARVIDSLEVGPVILVGHSMGSQWVVELGVERPGLVTDVVAMGPVADVRHRTILSQTMALAVDTLRETPDVNAIVFSDYLRCGPRWYLAQLRHMLTYPLEERVPLLAHPLLIIRGGRDPIAGLEWCRMLRDRAERGRLALIPGRHHVAQHGAPRAVAAAILANVGAELDPQTARVGHQS